MNAARWQRLRRLFDLVADVEETAREAVLEEQCPDDPELRAEVLGLVAHDDGSLAEARGELGDATLSLVPSRRAATRETEPVIGRSIEHIRIVRRLGSGGMGEVFLGFDEKLQREVALKSIRGDRRLVRDTRQRFLREARILSKLDHPNICRIHNFIEGTDQDLLVLELVKGQDLSRIPLDRVSEQRRLEIALQIAEALQAAHEAGVVHRDLKPQNVMLSDEGVVKVLDFGLAASGPRSSKGEPTGGRRSETTPGETFGREDETETLVAPRSNRAAGHIDAAASLHTRIGSIVGTPAYMSPEQANGEAVQTSSDMYSFGLLLQQLLSGEPAYPKHLSVDALLRRAAAAQTQPATGLSKPQRELVEQLLSRAPSARPTAATTVARLRWIADAPKRRLRRFLAAAALTLIVLAGLKYTTDLRAARDVAENRRAQAESLIGFMLGDLRTKLNEVGRLQLLDDIGERAAEYFGSVPPEQMSSEEVLFRSRSLNQIGDVRIAQGRLPEAAVAFQQALDLARELVARDPAREDFLARQGEAHFWLGNVYWQQERYEDARREWHDYLGSSLALARTNPDEPSWELEVAYGHSNLGAVARRLGENETAVESSSRAVAVMEALAKSDPGNSSYRRELATALSWLAGSQFELDRLEEAETSHREALRLRRQLLVEDPNNAQRLLEVAYSQAHLGELLFTMNQLDEARGHALQFHQTQSELVDLDPENVLWRTDLAVSNRLVARIESAAGHPDIARERIAQSLTTLEQAVRQDSSNDNWRFKLASTRIDAAWVEFEAQRWRQALRTAERAGHDLLELRAGGAQRQDLDERGAEALLLEGLSLLEMGQLAEAESKLQRATVAFAEGVDPTQSHARALWILAVSPTNASAQVRELFERGYRHPSLLAAFHRRGIEIPTSIP